jgi:hypothetical protein
MLLAKRSAPSSKKRRRWECFWVAEADKERGADKMPINQEKLIKLQQQKEKAQIGGKGTARRKKKVVHKTATDDKKLQVCESLDE